MRGQLVLASSAAVFTDVLWQLSQFGNEVPPVESQTSPGAGRGIKELVGQQFVQLSSQSRLIVAKARPLNYAFCVGLFFYFLRGASDVPSIEYYNPRARDFTDDGFIIPGSSYGARVKSQIDYVIELLRRDPQSRRAVVTIFDARDHRESKDIPCPVMLQFILRYGTLECLCYFRSQSIVGVFPYGVFLFTMVHEFVAAQLGVQVGRYFQTTGSMHYYLDEEPLVKALLEFRPASVRMQPMTLLEPGQFEALMLCESELRWYGAGVEGPPVLDSLMLRLPPYWQGIVLILDAFAKRRRAGERRLDDFNELKEIAGGLCL